MFRLLRKWRDRRVLQHHPVDAHLWTETLAVIPILDPLSEEERSRLKDLATLFLRRKTFLPVQGMALDEERRLLLAAIACYPVLNLGLPWLDGWQTLIVYPGRFRRPRRQMDSSGVMHEWSEILRGEAWERGPVVLSWADVEGSGLGDGYNVVIHEIAHQLDMLNGPADGFPPLHRSMRTSAWTDAFSTAFRALNATIDRGEEPPIDPYAAESPAEYFAVLSEYFFERPALIETHYPAIYQQLATFYRQNPGTGRDKAT